MFNVHPKVKKKKKQKNQNKTKKQNKKTNKHTSKNKNYHCYPEKPNQQQQQNIRSYLVE